MNLKPVFLSREKYYVLHKPYGYLSQFSDEAKHKGLKHLIDVEPDVYPAGRLDVDSEGLLILTNDNNLKHHLLNPQNKHNRTYHIQVDGTATSVHLNLLRQGVEITIEGKPYKTLPPQAVNLLNEVFILKECLRCVFVKIFQQVGLKWFS